MIINYINGFLRLKSWDLGPHVNLALSEMLAHMIGALQISPIARFACANALIFCRKLVH